MKGGESVVNVREVTVKELELLGGMTIGERLKWIREQLQAMFKKGYSINSVAKETGAISAQGLHAIESGKTANPSAKNIQALADYYRIPQSVLFDEYYITVNKPFELGDVGVVEPIVPPAKPASMEYRISVNGSKKDHLNLTANLTPKQLDKLMKRIKFELELLKEEEE
jgi:transcriptional regulator with XRE-family HTH domain